MCSAESFMTRRTGWREGGGVHQTSGWGWREPCLFGFVWFIDSGKMPFGHYPKGQKLQFWHFVGKRQGRSARAIEPNNVPSVVHNGISHFKATSQLSQDVFA